MESCRIYQMFSSAASVLFGCFLISQVHGDFFENHVRKFLNHSVRPCDDFYRHVCATENMKPNDYMTTYGNYLEEKWLKEMEEIHWQQSPPSIAELLIRAMETNPRVYVQIHDLRTTFPGLYNFFKMLKMARQKMHILEHPERKNLLLRDQLMREMFSMAREEIEQSTDRFGKEQIEQLTDRLEEIVYIITRYGDADDFRRSVKAFDRLLKKDKEFVELTEYNIVHMVGQILSVFERKYEDVLTAAMEWNDNGLNEALYGGSPWNARADPGRSAEFNDPVLAVSLNNSIPALVNCSDYVEPFTSSMATFFQEVL